MDVPGTDRLELEAYLRELVGDGAFMVLYMFTKIAPGRRWVRDGFRFHRVPDLRITSHSVDRHWVSQISLKALVGLVDAVVRFREDEARSAEATRLKLNRLLDVARSDNAI